MKRRNKTLALLALCLITLGARAHGAEPVLRLANSQGKSMVLQRDMPVPVWGWAPAGAEVTVSFKGQSKKATADADGRWLVTLHPLKADATAAPLIVSGGGATVTADDVLVGDVWLCAGPGIMRNLNNIPSSKPEIAKANFPLVRILRPDVYTSQVPVADVPAPARWLPATAENVAGISVAWYLGRELHAAEQVPVGLVLVNFEDGSARDWLAWKYDPADKVQEGDLKALAKDWAADITRTEAWLAAMDRRAADAPIDLLLFPSTIKYGFYNAHPIYDGPYPYNHTTSINYNAMVHPLRPMAVRGVVLMNEYKEQSTTQANDLQQVVASWREAWGRPGLPFVVAEPVLMQHKRVAAINQAIAATLPGVAVVPKPAAFSDRDSAAYWKSMAQAALALPRDTPAAAPVLETWAAPVPVTAAPASTEPRLELGHLFSDNMVLQCDQPVKVWGWAKPGATVEVTFAGQNLKTTVDAASCWQVTLAALKASTMPAEMTIQAGSESVTIRNVVVGEVWLNSGQSNAGFGMSSTLGFDEEKPKATNSAIRYFVNTRAANILPQRRNMGYWVVLSPETAGRMSGMGYYFAKSIFEGRQAPVGIIEANHGGSSIISWLSDAAVKSSPAFKTMADNRAAIREESLAVLPLMTESVRAWLAEARQNAALSRPVAPFPIDANTVRPFYTSFLQNPMERRGSMLYNTMIHPAIGYGIRGALWNQGEADTGSTISGPAIYDDLMAAMVADWRKSWGIPFAFYYVQMPAIKGRVGLLAMWQAQTDALAKIPTSGMSVSNDISESERGEAGIHPRDKKNVGERLARLALARTYGMKGIVDSSPMMESVSGGGNRVVVTFSTPGDGLKTRDGKPSDSWEIAGADGKYVPATAEVAGAKVTVSAEGVDAPVSVRLGWKPDSNCNLVNSAGLPALPFNADLPK